MDQSQTFSPRSGLKRTLSDRTLLKVFYYLLFPLSIAFVLPFIPIIIMAFEDGMPITAWSFVALALPMPAILMSQAFLFFRPMAFTQVQIYPDRLQMMGRDKKPIEVLFDEIETIKLSHMPYQGGSFVIHMKDGKSYKFTVILERSEYVLEAISSYNAELLPSDSFEDYRRTAICADHNYTRMNDALTHWKILVVKYLLLPVVTSVLILFAAPYVGRLSVTEDLDNVFRSVTLANLLLGICSFLVASLIMTETTNRALAKDPNNARRDLDFEKQIFTGAEVIRWVAFAAYAIYVLIR